MLILDEPVYQKSLANGMTIRTVSTLAELERICELNTLVHGEQSVGQMTYKIFSAHPDATGRDLVYIEDNAGIMVATLCLIPWTLTFGRDKGREGHAGITLNTGELGIVGTLERCRRQGLNRVLMDYYWHRFTERGCLLSIIQGIPNFYRQYGYEYAMLPLIGGLRLQGDQVPAAGVDSFHIRRATIEDIPALARLYDEQTCGQALSACRSQAVWEYLLTRTAEPEDGQHDTLIVEDASGDPAGYFRIPDFHFHPNLLAIDEVSDLNFQAALVVLNHAKGLSKERGKEGIRLQLPEQCGLMRLARSLGALDMGVYSWQVSIPDPAAFLLHLVPLFEKRLEMSMFAGLTGTFGLNLYKEVIGLTFDNGRLKRIGPAQEDGNTILSIPPTQFVPLALGGRSLDEIHTAFPDAFAHSPWALLVDTLFPKSQSYLLTNY